MARFLRLVSGVARSFDETAPLPIYDQVLTVVSGTPANGNQVSGPVSSGIAITLANSGSYTGVELEVFLNGSALEMNYDWNTSGISAPYSAISFTFQLIVGDVIAVRKYRGA